MGEAGWLWRLMEQTDVTVQAAIARRLSFIDSIDWEIRVTAGANPLLAAEQADLLQYAYNRIANFKEATKFLGSALFRGFAHLEKIETGYANLVARLDPVPQPIHHDLLDLRAGVALRALGERGDAVIGRVAAVTGDLDGPDGLPLLLVSAFDGTRSIRYGRAVMVALNGKIDGAMLAELVERLRTAAAPTRILLFGSAARNAMSANSDIDVLVIVRDGISRRATTQAIYRRLYGFPMATDVVVVTEDDVTRYANTEGLIIRKALEDGREIFRAA